MKHPLAGRKQNAEHIRKRVEARFKNNPLYFKTKNIPWNKGKTKKTDPRIAKQADKLRLGRKFNAVGYVLVYRPDHPKSDRCGYILEHIVEAEKKLGRFMFAHEVVHHIDGKKDNNKIENLEVMTQSEHIKIHKPDAYRKF